MEHTNSILIARSPGSGFGPVTHCTLVIFTTRALGPVCGTRTAVQRQARGSVPREHGSARDCRNPPAPKVLAARLYKLPIGRPRFRRSARSPAGRVYSSPASRPYSRPAKLPRTGGRKRTNKIFTHEIMN
jgi:hypothetical protein